MDKDEKTKDRIEKARREFLKSGLSFATAVAASGIPAQSIASKNMGGVKVVEKSHVNLGFIPLTDCASLVIAQEKGFFDKHGVNVSLKKQSSWSNIRDKVMVGALDGAHMLASMPVATSLGIGTAKKPTLTAFTMALNGNGITVSHELYVRMLEADPQAMQESPITAKALKKVIEEDKKAGRPLMTFATVFPVSTHNYELRYWMAAAGIDPDKDVRLAVIPPAYMVANLESQKIVGYCVGEPWNELAVKSGFGRTLITKYEIWNNSPEKVFGVNKEWADKNPQTHQAIIMALIEASAWIEDNRAEVAEILAREEYVNAPVDVVKMSMTGTFQYARHLPPKAMPDFNVFHRYSANYPWQSHAQWFITQMYRWGQIEEGLSVSQVAAEVYRPDIYTSAAALLGIQAPAASVKVEGQHAEAWQLSEANTNIQMGADKFFDHHLFNPKQAIDYIYEFDVSHPRISKKELQQYNV